MIKKIRGVDWYTLGYYNGFLWAIVVTYLAALIRVTLFDNKIVDGQIVELR